MTKMLILTTCEACNGKSQLLVGEAEDFRGNKYTRYQPCPTCEGVGLKPKWIELAAFARMLQKEQYLHQHTSFTGKFHFDQGDVWDNIQEVCDDCGVTLDRQTLGDYIHDLA